MVLAACAGMWGGGILSYTVGLFVEPLQREFGWSRVEIMAGPGITALVCFLGAPFVGAQIDRLGARRLGIGGMIVLGLLVSCLGVVGPNIWSWLFTWFLLACAYCFLLPNIWASSVSGFFHAGRGVAMGITLCGSSLNSLVMPLYCYFLISHFGWRSAFLGLGGFLLIFIVPLLLLFLTSARDQARLGKREQRRSEATRLRDWKRHLLTRRFIQLALGAFLTAAVVPPLVINAVPVLTAGGLSRLDAAAIASLIGFTSILGRVGIGWLLDRIDGRIVAAAVVCLPVITAILLIKAPGSVPVATVAILFLGLALGAESDMVAYLTSRYFKLDHFAMLFGTVTALIALAGSGGPVVLSAVYDHFGSYVPALWATIPLCPLAALLFISLGPYPADANDRSEESRPKLSEATGN
ncbi:MFS transporter [Sphingobium tyrosinilyticum]|uniref:MFS transporter n=1 Tax=Sphingobium tyrosinilyticum TaxID=2715436 RepID=A0ABV9F309_9SPHN